MVTEGKGRSSGEEYSNGNRYDPDSKEHQRQSRAHSTLHEGLEKEGVGNSLQCLGSRCVLKGRNEKGPEKHMSAS